MSAFFSLKFLGKYRETKGLVLAREEKQKMKPDLHKMWEKSDFIQRRKKETFFFFNPKFYMQSGKSLGVWGHFHLLTILGRLVPIFVAWFSHL